MFKKFAIDKNVRRNVDEYFEFLFIHFWKKVLK